MANRFYRWPLALAVYSCAHPPGPAMVEGSQFLPRFLRPAVFRLRDLAGAVAAHPSAPAAFVVGFVVVWVRIVRSGGRSDGRGAFPVPVLDVDRTGRLDRALSRVEFLPRPSVSLGIPAFDDPHSSYSLQPNHLPAAVAGIEGGQHHFALDGRSCATRGQRYRPSGHGFGGSRRLQRHPFADVTHHPGDHLWLSDGT